MVRKTIRLTTREELNTYMSPVRQELLRTLRLSGEPMTPKELSLRLKISASSVQHHLKKLLDLGVVEVDHRALINGITATYYRDSPVEVRMGMERGDDLREEREAMVGQRVEQVYGGFVERTRQVRGGMDEEALQGYAYLTSGLARLLPGERAGLLETVRRDLEAHERPGRPGEETWEYLIVAYRPEEQP